MDQLVQVVLSGLSQGAIYALIGLGFSLVFMSARILNLAQGSFALLGGFLFTTFARFWELPPFVAAILVLAVVAAVGLAAERVVNFRARPWQPVSLDVAVLTTLALFVVFEGAAFLIWGPDPIRGPAIQRGTFSIFGAVVLWQSVWMFVAMIVIAIGLHFFLRYTWMGQAMRACAQNQLTAYLLGINARRVGMVAFSISAMLGAVAGILVSPVTYLDYQIGGYFMLQGVLAYLIGGEEEVAGPIVGGIFLGLVENLVLLLPEGGLLKQVVPLLLLILILVWRPQGIIAKKSAGSRT